MKEVSFVERQKTIVRTGVIGIIANLLLSGFKAAVGLLSNSIAMMLDAVNNLSDALSSVITIISTKLSDKPADKKHPFGYGRIEFISTSIIAVIILYAGVTSLIESVKRIVNPETPDYGTASLIVLSVAVLVKIILGLYVMRIGRSVDSDSLKASGKDALFDAAISASVLIAAVIYLIWGVSPEAYLGVVIALFIIKAGVEMVIASVSSILGERIDSTLSKEIKRSLCRYPQVSGAYDLVLHNYGPGKLVGSVHIEVPETITAVELDALERQITADICEKHGVLLTGISIYSINLSDPEVLKMHDAVIDMIMDYQEILQMHGFYLNRESKTVAFDLVISFDTKDKKAVYDDILFRLQAEYPGYTFRIALDGDFSD